MFGPAILLPHQVDVKNLKIIPNREAKSTIKNFLIGYGPRGLLHVQLPECEAFNLSPIINPLTKMPYNANKLNLTIKMSEDRKSCQAAIAMFNDLKTQIIKLAAENSLMVYGRSKNEAFISDCFTDMVRYSKKKDSNGNITNELNTDLPPLVSFPVYKEEDGKLGLQAESASGKPICLDNRDIKGSYVTIIARLNGMWTNGSASGMTWRIIKVRVIFVSRPNKNISFLADEDRLATDYDSDDELDPEYDEPQKKIPQRMNMFPESEDEDEAQPV